MTAIRLSEIAHARAGDKGDSSILFLAPLDPANWDVLVLVITPQAIAVHFDAPEPGRVTITSVPTLRALSIVVASRLGGGVTRSVGIDPHGKTLSGHLLDMVVEVPDPQ